jgi:hypothetical protein
MPSRFASRTRRSRAPSWPAGARCRELKLWMGSIRSGMTSRRHVSVWLSTGRFLSIYADVAESRVGEQLFQPIRISQCEREVDYISMLREKATERIGKNTPHWCTVWGGDDTYCRGAPNTKDAAELTQSASRVRKELQAELAYHGVKTAVLDGNAWPSAPTDQNDGSPSRSRSFQHRGRDVRSDHETRSAGDRERHPCGLARSGGDIEHSAPRPHLPAQAPLAERVETTGPPSGHTLKHQRPHRVPRGSLPRNLCSSLSPQLDR